MAARMSFRAFLVIAAVAVILIASNPGLRPVGCSWVQEKRLKVGAFNIESFGLKKMSNSDVADAIAEILVRYDVVLIQEIRDRSERAITKLLERVNEMNDGRWAMKLSKRRGSSYRYQEQLAYFYRKDKVEIAGVYQWPYSWRRWWWWSFDYQPILFERPPYIVRIKVIDQPAVEFGFIGAHLKPDRKVTYKEMNRLADVYDEMVRMWGLDDFIIGGDLNAGTNYIAQWQWPHIRLHTDSDRTWNTDYTFHWIIGDNQTSTIGNQCHDRFVLAGERMRNVFYVEGSGKVNRYESVRVNNVLVPARKISDHYPIEMDLRY